MTDDQIEKFILKEIRHRGITLYDMISLANQGVDPTPEKGPEGDKQRYRCNIFTENFGSERMKELLAVGGYNRYDPYTPIKIPFQDLFRFWWNRCVDRDLVLNEVLEDIFDYFTELLRPPEKEKEEIDLELDFSTLPLLDPQEKSVSKHAIS